MNAWTPIMPGVYAPAKITKLASRTRPAWFPHRLVRRPSLRVHMIDARRLPY